VVVDLNVGSASLPVVLPGRPRTIYHTEYVISVHALGKCPTTNRHRLALLQGDFGQVTLLGNGFGDLVRKWLICGVDQIIRSAQLQGLGRRIARRQCCVHNRSSSYACFYSRSSHLSFPTHFQSTLQIFRRDNHSPPAMKDHTPPPVASIAIIGASCQLPSGVDSTNALWDFCSKAQCSARPYPESRFKSAHYYHPAAHKQGHFNDRAGSFLDRDISSFDASFFNYHGKA
jgi:hypothetical protein